ncbi:MAG: hypothetical protein CSA81_08855 [Acidobacteria bacterium]|nr:MAG: hypothetical protein CSA81_08855 [Acidobacteriota bacterium]
MLCYDGLNKLSMVTNWSTPLEDSQQKKLFQSLQAGSSQAWETYYRQLGPSVLRYLRSIGAPYPEDILQETFVALFHQASKLRPDTIVQAWLFKVSRNKTIQSKQGYAMNSLDDKQTIPHTQHSREDILTVQKLVRHLKEPFKSTLALFHWEGMTVEEIAKITETTKSTVKTRLYRARQQLKEQLKEGSDKERLSPRKGLHLVSLIFNCPIKTAITVRRHHYLPFYLKQMQSEGFKP